MTAKELGAYLDQKIAELKELERMGSMIVHGSNCGCRNVLVHVAMIPGGLKRAQYVRVCQIEGKPDDAFWTVDRRNRMTDIELMMGEGGKEFA